MARPFRESLSSVTDDNLEQRLALTRFVASLGLETSNSRSGGMKPVAE